jgi:hypothetical protein
MYRSFKVLTGAINDSPNLRPYDYMDDLESFFYVLCHVLFLYKGGSPMDPFSTNRTLVDLNSGHPMLKFAFITRREVDLSAYLIHDERKATVLYDLMDNLRQFFRDVVDEVEIAIVKRNPKAMRPAESWDEYVLLATKAYDKFLGYVATAITRIPDDDRIETGLPSTTAIPGDLSHASPPSIPSSSLVPAYQSPPSPSPSIHLVLPPSLHVSSSSHGTKRRRAPTLLPDAQEARTQADVGDRSEKGRKKMKGARG